MRHLALALLLVAGCKKAPSTDPSLEQVNEALSSAGLKLDPFTPADASRFSAQLCMAGRIEGIDAMLCQFAAPDGAHAAKRAGEDWIGTAPTGVTLDRGRVLLLLADRGRADPNGRSIHKITQAFQGKL